MIIAAILFALPLLLFAACKPLEPRDEVDVIPDTLGASEGLWLYKGNRRTRTDGTEEEKLLTSLTVDGEEYGAEDFKIVSYLYVKGTCEIFYIILIGDDCRLCHYNYLTKDSSDLYDLPDTESPRDYHMNASDSIVYTTNDTVRFGVIFSCTAQFMYEDFYGTLNGDVVYRITGTGDEYVFEYIRDGEKHTVVCDEAIRYHSPARYGNYFYCFGTTAHAIDLEKEEWVALYTLQTPDHEYYTSADRYYLNGSLYVLTCAYSRDHDNDDSFYRFIRITGASAKVEYDFGNAPYGIYMTINGSTFYFHKDAERDIQNQFFAYDAKKGSMKRITAGTYRRGKGQTTEELQEAAAKAAAEKDKELAVGGYTFYVDSIGYDKQSGMFSSYYAKTCYYLMRRNGDTEEFMQYSLNKNHGYFFDDIREF